MDIKLGYFCYEAFFFNMNMKFDFETGIWQIGSMPIHIYGGIIIFMKILVIIILMYTTIKIGFFIINKSVEKQSKLKFSIDNNKSKTIGAILKSILRYAVYFFGIVGMLTQFGPISLTFAGIGGVAIGFGAQNLIKDILNGFFILFEDQYTVGEYIHIDDKGGIVESTELRVTKIRDFNGDLYIIPNGLITKVTNHSRGAMRILVQVTIEYKEEVDNAITVINNVCREFKEGNAEIIEVPKVLGVTELSFNGVTIKIAGKVKAMTQWQNENDLRKVIKKALDDAKIEIAHNKTSLVRSGDSAEGI